MSVSRATRHDRLWRAHQALMGDLRSLLADTGAMPIAVLHNRLLRTKQDLSEHFQLEEEEEEGYLSCVQSQAPNFVQLVDELAGEHRELLDALDEILASLNQSQPHLADVREQCRIWVQKVRDHEIRETDLMQDAFLDDLGTGD